MRPRRALAVVAGGAGTRIGWEHDFGDSWEHEIVLERVMAAEEGVRIHRSWQEKAPARRKTAPGRGDTADSGPPWPIPAMRSTSTWCDGRG